MFHRSALAAAAVGAALFASAQAHAAPAMSLNNIVRSGLPHQDCMQLALDVIREAGFRFKDQTSQAVWGTNNGGTDIVSIYCLTTADIAVFAAATDSSSASNLINRLTEAWRRLR